jgi:hypothetical protein
MEGAYKATTVQSRSMERVARERDEARNAATPAAGENPEITLTLCEAREREMTLGR